MGIKWTVTIDSDTGATVIFEASTDKIANEVSAAIQEVVSSTDGTGVSMISVVMRAEEEE